MIRVENLSYWYPKTETPALQDIHFHVQPGELVLVTGQSGSGKSTLLHCLKGLIPHMYGGNIQGKIIVNGQDISQLSVVEISKHVGLVMQDPESQFCNLFVRDEVAFGLENMKLDPAVCIRRTADALVAVNLQHCADRTVIELSGGEKQRVAIATILAMEVPILLLDEPTANLDSKSGREIIQFVSKLRESGKTILLIQHELDEAIHLVDKLLLLEGCTILDFGHPREIIEKYGSHLTSEHHIGLPQIAHAALRTHRWFSFDRLPLSAAEFATYVRHVPVGQVVVPIESQADTTNGSLPMVEAEEVHYAYPHTKKEAVKGISLKVRPSEVTAILGKNGSGKSTLARILVGLLEPQIGKVKLHGQDVHRLKKHQIHNLTGYVFQYPEHQFLAQTVAKEIAYGLEVQQQPEEKIHKIVSETIVSLRLSGAEQRHPFSLSGGEKRRLSVATMLVLEPQLLILDEPTYGLDEGNLLNMVRFLFEQLRKKGVTILFITHDLRLVAEHADRAVVLHDGKLTFDGPPTQLFNDTELMEQAELVPPPIVELVQALERRGIFLPQHPVTLDQFAEAVEMAFASSFVRSEDYTPLKGGE